MESPVVVDKPPEYHGNPGNNQRGFPFDEEEGSGAWSELAARHPDIAARLRQRPATWARKRRPSSQDATEDFGDSFSGFDRFPFDDIPPEFREHFPSHWNRRFGSREEPQPQAPPSPQPQQHTAATQTEQDPGPSEPQDQQTHIPNYGLRNTVDLGQKSAADPSLVDAEERNQRSMSAPPDHRTANQSNAHKMSGQNHHEQPQPPHSEQASNVRHIPIFVEGRDEPVINKSVDHGGHFGETKPTYVPPPQPDRRQYYDVPDDGPVYHAPPNFSRTFGTPFNKGFRQGSQPFVQQKAYPQTAFARGASPQRSQSPQMYPEEQFMKVPVHHEQPQRQEPPSRPQPKQQPPPPQQHHQPPPQQHQPPPPQQPQPPQQQQQRAATPPKPQPPSANDPISQILSIQTDVLNLMTEVENFTGSKKDKQYLFLDEMLTRNLIKLDNIETDGKENIRQARKEAIRCIQKCIAVLEAKADKGSAPAQDVDMKENAEKVDEAPEQVSEPVTENGEVDMKEAPKEEAKSEPQPEPAAQPQEQKEEAPKPNEEQKIEQEQPAENKEKEAQPEVADTRPDENKPAESTETKPDEQKTDDKASPKKGTKAVKKRDKSKDNKDVPKDSNKEKDEKVMQVDDKGDKIETQAMEIDGAASQ